MLLENVVKCKTYVKILVPIEDKITSTIQRLQQIDGINIRNIEPTIQTRMTILVVDKKYSLDKKLFLRHQWYPVFICRNCGETFDIKECTIVRNGKSRKG